MRVPLPLKVLFAFLAVVVAGAAPAYLYTSHALASDIAGLRSAEAQLRADRLAETLAAVPQSARAQHVKRFADGTLDEVVYIDPAGAAVIDTRAQASEPLRPGIRRDGDTFWVAATTSVSAAGDTIGVVLTTTEVSEFRSKLVAVLRNSGASAVTVALLLTLLAVLAFMQPLQRLARAANRIADGDYTGWEKWSTNDEISAAGEALAAMAMRLRTRLANAHASETLLIQAAEFLDVPVAVVAPDCEVITINGPFREIVEDGSELAEEVVSRLYHSKKYGKTVHKLQADANDDGVMHWTRKKIGIVLQMQLLERPGGEPLALLTAHESDESSAHLPLAEAVEPTALETVLRAGIDRARPHSEGCTFEIEWVDAKPNTKVVEVERRVEHAVALALESAATSEKHVKLSVAKTRTSVNVWVDAEVSTGAVRLARHLLLTCGGRVEDDEFMTLRLALA